MTAGAAGASRPLVEVCFLLGVGGALLWADVGDDATSLGDSRARWEAVWAHRGELGEIVHSHPGGSLRFSLEDESTMKAIDAGLGRRLDYGIVSPAGYLRRRGDGSESRVTDEPWWTRLLRAASGL
ncbi:MAG TPA: Mov34/MPN/PAD-1 family protein [Acidimicrobiales bacterium]|nr:Mov34/MPN/PAD-1 family protein [Acidimicrobiales bacterium]